MNPGDNRLGIFGGTFDPVHSGHVSIARSFLKSNLIHSLLILPTPDPPHKTDKSLTEFKHRYQMLELAFADMDGIEISNLERRLPTPSYTLQTVNYLQKKHPDTCFYLCMGEDSLMNFTSWHQYRKILDKVYLLAAERTGYGNRLEIPEEVLDCTVFAEHQALNISSSHIRRQGESADGTFDKLPDPVSGYIKDNNLYR